MNTDQILTDVFAEQAEQRPDGRDVLAAVHRRLDRRHQASITRSLAVLGSAAAVATVAVGVAATTSGGHSTPNRQAAGAAPGDPVTSQSNILTPAPGATVPRSGEATASTASDASTAPTGPDSATTSSMPLPNVPDPIHSIANRPANARDYSTIAAGWLPGRTTQTEASNQPGFEERDYTVSVDGSDMDVIIYLEDGAMPTRTEAGTHYRSLTINGHPAREFVADVATIVAVDLGNGKVAYAGPSVVATTRTLTTARITAIAEHVAGSMQFDRHDPIH